MGILEIIQNKNNNKSQEDVGVGPFCINKDGEIFCKSDCGLIQNQCSYITPKNPVKKARHFSQKKKQKIFILRLRIKIKRN